MLYLSQFPKDHENPAIASLSSDSSRYFPGMIVRDYCANGMTAVSMAEELFPQFGSSEAQCQKDPNKLMLGK